MNYMFYNLNRLQSLFLKMTTKITIEAVKENTEVAKRTIIELKNELHSLSVEYNNIRAEQLKEENAKLLLAVEKAKSKLINLEIENGVKQISLPDVNVQNFHTSLNNDSPKEALEALKVEDKPISNAKESKPKKEKKVKEVKEKDNADNAPIDIGRLDLRIAKIEEVQKHPDADTLYVLKINCGEEKSRTVCSGLVKHIPMDDLKDRMVLLLCNLKPVKMRGITSEAMIMCASTSDAVEVLIPPKESVLGEPIECDGYTRMPDPVMNPKKKIFETVAPDLHTNDNLEACYKGTPFLVPGKGPILSKTLKNVAVK